MSGARHRIQQRDEVDWFRVITDLQYLGMTTLEAAQRLSEPESSLRSWKNGSEPRYSSGKRLLDLWCDMTGKSLQGAPLKSAGFRRFT